MSPTPIQRKVLRVMAEPGGRGWTDGPRCVFVSENTPSFVVMDRTIEPLILANLLHLSYGTGRHAEIVTGAPSFGGLDAHVTRTQLCPNCQTPWWEKAVTWRDGQSVPVWECPNCGTRVPRQERKAGTEITPSQQRAIQHLLSRVTLGIRAVKNHTIEMTDYGMAVLVIEVGSPNDEGSALELFRDHYQFFIGRSGRIIYYKGGEQRVLGPMDSVTDAKL